MLSKIIDNNVTKYLFMASPDRLSLVFARRTAFAQENPVQALWVRAVADTRTLLSLQRWVAVRRDMWEVWGRLAEAVGPASIVSHMEKLLDESPVGEVTGTIVHRDESDACVLSLGETLFGHGGLQMEELYRHRFASPEMGDRFFEWFYTGDNMGAAEVLVHIGFNAGTDAVGELMDRIAVEMPESVPASGPASRRPSRRQRSLN